MGGERVDGDDFFDGRPAGQAIYRAVARYVLAMDGVSVRATRSQVAFTRRRDFALVWRPGQYVASDVPAAVSFALPHPLTSDRITSVAHPSPKAWMHHVELRSPAEFDTELRAWLEDAWVEAG